MTIEVSDEARAILGHDERRWNSHADLGTPVVITYSFAKSEAAYLEGLYDGYTEFANAQKEDIRQALEVWAQAAGITFVEVTGKHIGDIQFSMIDLSGRENSVGNQSSGFGYYPGFRWHTEGGEVRTYSPHGGVHGDIFLHSGYFAGDPNSLQPGVRGFSLVLHELGHALGLKHPFEGSPEIDPAFDNGTVTVMSYDRSRSTVDLGYADIEAMTYLYGDPGESLKARWIKKKATLEIVGTGGADDIDGSHHKDKIVAKRGDDEVRGDQGQDRLFGNGGADTLMGGDGKDVLIGGRGGDHLYGGDQKDVLKGGGGNDTLYGEGGNDRLIGGAGRDVFVFDYFGGVDTIVDFQPGKDLIHFDINGAAFSWVNFTEKDGLIEVEVFGRVVKVVGVDLLSLNNADNFLF